MPARGHVKAMREVSGPVMAIALILAVGLHPDRVHPRDHGPAVPAVRADHRDKRDHLGVQCAHLEPGPQCAAAQAARRAADRSAPSRGFNRWFDKLTGTYVSIDPQPHP